MKRFIILIIIVIISGCGKDKKPVKYDPRFPDQGMINGIEYYSGKSIENVSDEDLLKFKEILHGKTIYSIKGIELCKNLEHLELQRTEISDISYIKDLTKLRHLNIWKTNITDLTPIENLVNLEELSLRQTKITNLYSVKRLKKLKSLHYYDNSKKCLVDDFTPLSGLENIEVIEIRIDNIKKLPDFSKMKKLKILSLQINKNLDAQIISEALNIEELILYGKVLLLPNDFSKMTKLKKVTIGSSTTMNASSVATGFSIETIVLKGKFKELEWLENMPNLKEVSNLTDDDTPNDVFNRLQMKGVNVK